MVSKISDLLVEKVDVGDPPVAVSLGKLTLDVRKKEATDVVKEPVASHIGKQKVNGQLDVPPGTCVVSQVTRAIVVTYGRYQHCREYNNVHTVQGSK